MSKNPKILRHHIWELPKTTQRLYSKQEEFSAARIRMREPVEREIASARRFALLATVFEGGGGAAAVVELVNFRVPSLLFSKREGDALSADARPIR